MMPTTNSSFIEKRMQYSATITMPANTIAAATMSLRDDAGRLAPHAEEYVPTRGARQTYMNLRARSPESPRSRSLRTARSEATVHVPLSRSPAQKTKSSGMCTLRNRYVSRMDSNIRAVDAPAALSTAAYARGRSNQRSAISRPKLHPTRRRWITHTPSVKGTPVRTQPTTKSGLSSKAPTSEMYLQREIVSALIDRHHDGRIQAPTHAIRGSSCDGYAGRPLASQ